MRFDRPGSECERVDVPDESPAVHESGAVVIYRRSFNCPSGLKSNDSVWLSIELLAPMAIHVRLNDVSIHEALASAPIRLKINATLQPANQLEIQLRRTDGVAARLTGSVCLEIESQPI